MEFEHTIRPIAYIQNDFKEKFGIPRQSGLADTTAKIVFEPEYRSREAVRGMEMYSHFWLLWQFSESVRDSWSPTVRPPRLGGNIRMGVFATRSPFRPQLHRAFLRQAGPYRSGRGGCSGFVCKRGRSDGRNSDL